MEERLVHLEEGQMALREQVARLNGEVEQMNTRLNGIEHRQSQTFWAVIGMWVTIWATLLGAILAILFKG